MGSVGNPNPWAPYDDYRNCSQVICSLYCPQWCYILFPPPPPEDDSGSKLSPLIIALIAILASAFLIVCYYTVVSKYCRRRDQNPGPDLEDDQHEMNQDQQWQGASAGLDEALIKSITVYKYKKADGLVEGTDCSVCLSEFQEEESLRLLPKCNHAFHLPCIDVWLKSHSSCPLCRSNIAILNPPPPLPAPVSQNSHSLQLSSPQIQHRSEAFLLVDDLETGHHVEEVVVSFAIADPTPKPPCGVPGDLGNTERSDCRIEIRQEGLQQLRRSFSFDSSARQGRLLVADILDAHEDDDNFQLGNCGLSVGIGSSKQLEGDDGKSNNGSVLRSVAMTRSVSTGRSMFTRQDKWNNSLIPN